MRISRIDCPYCGANIDIDNERVREKNIKIIHCTYCGKQIMVESDDTTAKKNINITQNINHHVTNDAEIIKEQNRHSERLLMLLAAY